MTLELTDAEALVIQRALWDAKTIARLDLEEFWKANSPISAREETPLLRRLLDLNEVERLLWPASPIPGPFLKNEAK